MNAWRRAFRRRPAHGFTIMELMVAMVLLAMLVGIAAPTVESVLGIEIKGKARQLAGTMRYLFNEAVIQSSNFRIVFNLDRHSYAVEVCEGPSAILYRSADDRRRGEDKLEEEKRRQESSARSGTPAVPLADVALGSCTQATSEELAPVTLDEPLAILGVWTPQYGEVLRGHEGGPPEDAAEDIYAVVNFLKGGYAERAYVYISDGGEDIYTLELEPLTGQVILHEGLFEVPREYWRPE